MNLASKLAEERRLRLAAERLLEQNGHYAELYNTYFRHQSLAYVEQIKEMVAK